MSFIKNQIIRRNKK